MKNYVHLTAIFIFDGFYDGLHLNAGYATHRAQLDKRYFELRSILFGKRGFYRCGAWGISRLFICATYQQ
jgi:hypothetical protein